MKYDDINNGPVHNKDKDRQDVQKTTPNAEFVAQNAGKNMASQLPPMQMYEGRIMHILHRVESKSEIDSRLERNYLKIGTRVARGKRGPIERRYLKYANWEAKNGKKVKAYLGALKQMKFTLHNFKTGLYIRTTLKDSQGNIVINNLAFDGGLIPQLKRFLSHSPTFRGGNFKKWLYRIAFLKPDPRFTSNVGSKWLAILKQYLNGNLSDKEYLVWSDIISICKGNQTVRQSVQNFDTSLENYIIDSWANYGANPAAVSNKLVKLDQNLTQTKNSWNRLTKSPHAWIKSYDINKWYKKKKAKLSLLGLGNWIPNI